MIRQISNDAISVFNSMDKVIKGAIYGKVGNRADRGVLSFGGERSFEFRSLRGNATNGSHDRGNPFVSCSGVCYPTSVHFINGLPRSVPPLAMTAFGFIQNSIPFGFDFL